MCKRATLLPTKDWQKKIKSNSNMPNKQLLYNHICPCGDAVN